MDDRPSSSSNSVKQANTAEAEALHTPTGKIRKTCKHVAALCRLREQLSSTLQHQQLGQSLQPIAQQLTGSAPSDGIATVGLATPAAASAGAAAASKARTQRAQAAERAAPAGTQLQYTACHTAVQRPRLPCKHEAEGTGAAASNVQAAVIALLQLQLDAAEADLHVHLTAAVTASNRVQQLRRLLQQQQQRLQQHGLVEQQWQQHNQPPLSQLDWQWLDLQLQLQQQHGALQHYFIQPQQQPNAEQQNTRPGLFDQQHGAQCRNNSTWQQPWQRWTWQKNAGNLQQQTQEHQQQEWQPDARQQWLQQQQQQQQPSVESGSQHSQQQEVLLQASNDQCRMQPVDEHHQVQQQQQWQQQQMGLFQARRASQRIQVLQEDQQQQLQLQSSTQQLECEHHTSAQQQQCLQQRQLYKTGLQLPAVAANIQKQQPHSAADYQSVGSVLQPLGVEEHGMTTTRSTTTSGSLSSSSGGSSNFDAECWFTPPVMHSAPSKHIICIKWSSPREDAALISHIESADPADIDKQAAAEAVDTTVGQQPPQPQQLPLHTETGVTPEDCAVEVGAGQDHQPFVSSPHAECWSTLGSSHPQGTQIRQQALHNYVAVGQPALPAVELEGGAKQDNSSLLMQLRMVLEDNAVLCCECMHLQQLLLQERTLKCSSRQEVSINYNGGLATVQSQDRSCNGAIRCGYS